MPIPQPATLRKSNMGGGGFISKDLVWLNRLRTEMEPRLKIKLNYTHAGPSSPSSREAPAGGVRRSLEAEKAYNRRNPPPG